MKPKIHSVLQKGDKLMLDLGYGCHEMMEECTVIEASMIPSLFDRNQYELCARVKDSNGSTFTTTLIRA